MNKWIITVLSAILLVACGNEESARLSDKVEKEQLESKEDIQGETVGFTMNDDGTIEEASGVPEDEKEKIIALFEEYIQSFNDKDIERYMKTIAENPKGFNYEEERNYTLETFDMYDMTRIAEDLTVVKYSKDEAQVHANLTIHLTELATGNEVTGIGKQVTVLTKENGQWGVSSVHRMMENE